MKRLIPILASVAVCATLSGNLRAQNVNVAGATTGNGTYPTLGAAFTAINSGSQTGANILVTIVASTTETATASLGAGTWSTVTIMPAGGAARLVSGSVAGPLVDFNGADRVFVDGVNSGGNSLTFENTSTGAVSTIQFINDADMIAVQNCTILGAGTSTTSGTVFFGAGTSTGNDSIGFSACVIDASGANFATNGVYSAGTAGMENGDISFVNCHVINTFNPGSVTVGISAAANNTNWTISGCRIYQAASRTYTTANTHRAIQITSGNGHSILNNIIGFATSAGTGVYTMAGTIATRFIAIDLAVGTTVATSVQGNTISGFQLNTSSGAATTNGIWCGINVTAGNVNIGTTAGNMIGSTIGTASINCVPTTTQGAAVGMNISSTGTVVIQNNTIGALSSSGVTAAVAGSVFGINISGAVTNLVITGNTIGNATANNMNAGTAGLTTGSSLACGINISGVPATTSTITNNIIRNFSSNGTGASSYVRGIQTSTTGSTTLNVTMTGNTIFNLTTASSLTSMTSGQVSAAGIQYFCSGTSAISNNTIHTISNTNTGTGQYIVAGITLAASPTVGEQTVSGNTIYNLANAGTSTTATAPPVVAGIGVRSGPANAYNINNNMISLGNGQTTNTAFVGIWGNHGSTPNPSVVNIFFNSINIEGTQGSGAHSSFCIHRGDFTATQRTISYDIRNNIMTNNRTGGTGVHCAIGNNMNSTASATGWSASNNNNVLNTANAATVGYWGSALTFAQWQVTSATDGASYSGISVVYVNSASNLHLNMGLTPTVIESGAQTIATINTDIDGQTRPGPVGSVNGGGILPDIGADEFDGVYLDLIAPAITYTPLTYTCAITDRTITATIVDVTGVPTTGVLQPRIYFRKNAGPWFSTQGVLTSGTGQNGTWSFSIVSATMGGLAAGDVVSYFVIAQDGSPAVNITSNPAAGLSATDVNTVNTPPTTPNSYPISGFLSGTYTVGVSGTYPTLTAAVNAYNTSCLAGPVVFSLIDANYSTSETFPISIAANPDASAVNTLTIKPANPGTVIDGNATAIIRFDGSDYVTLDGSASSTANNYCAGTSASRDLTITNQSTAAATAVIWISSQGTGAGATHVTVKNCNIANGVDMSVSATDNYGIVSCGATITTFPPPDGADNDYNTIENNAIVRATWGVYVRGVAANLNMRTTISMNTIGPAAFGPLQIRKGGIILQNVDSASVTGNEVRCVGNQVTQTVGGTDHVAIGLGGADGPTPATTTVTNSTVTNNDIHDIVCEKTFSAIGIQIAVPNTSASNNLVANNFISNVRTNATSPDQGIGINVANGNGDRILFNSINMVTADRDPVSSTTATQSDIGVRFQAGAVNIVFENNIIHMDAASNTGTLMNFAVVAPSAAYVWGVSDYNDYSINAAGPQNVLFGLGTTGTIPPVNTLAAWQTTFTPAQDANSLNVVPVFTSATDLHIDAASNTALLGVAVAIPGITSDIECESRGATPDLGADETCLAAGTPTVSVTPSATICAGDTITLQVTGLLNESSDWEWYSASCGGTPEGSGASISVIPSATGDYFVRGEGGCASNGNCAMISITVNPLPSVTASSTSPAVCAGDNLTLNGGGAVSYTWSGPETVTDNTPFVPTLSGVYVVTGTDANGCQDTASLAVVVNALPTVTASPATNTVCAGAQVTLSGSGATSYTWNGPEAVTDNTPFTPTVNGTYTVTGTDANGCTGTDTAMVAVNALPSVTASATATTVCFGDSITLSGGGANTYTWSGPETVTDNVAYSATMSGAYVVTGTDVNGCVDTASIAITVNALPTVTFGLTLDTACTTTTPVFALTGGSPAGGVYTGPGVSAGMFDVSLANMGYNVITYTYTDSATGCQNSSVDSIWVDICNGIGNTTTVSVWNAVPNPNDGVFSLTSTNAQAGEMVIEVFAADGRLVSSSNREIVKGPFTEQIDLRDEAMGVYMVRIVNNGTASVIRVVRN